MPRAVMTCPHEHVDEVEGLTGSGWYVGHQCQDCGETLDSRYAGRSINGPI